MNPDKQRIAIAEACGWTASPNQGALGGWIARGPSGRHGYDAIAGTHDGALLRCCPEYLNDLNAMHEAEKALGDLGKWWSYCDHLKSIVKMTKGSESHVAATAAQRAEAFLKTIGKWDATHEGGN